MFDTSTHYGAQSTPSSAVGCSPMREAEDEALISALRRIYLTKDAA